MKKLLLILFLIFLTSCSQTGTKNLALIRPQLEAEANNKVFIYSQLGYYETLMNKFNIELNGYSIGKIGNNEIIIGDVKNGRNTLMVKGEVSPITGVMEDSNLYNFQNKSLENRYFIITINKKLLKGKIVLNEVTKQSFMKNLN
tara:strand:+ start:410 stop:841 length:432 start_codon:yes stop_codon:yes gene_type:complete